MSSCGGERELRTGAMMTFPVKALTTAWSLIWDELFMSMVW